jgi:MFS family permease
VIAIVAGAIHVCIAGALLVITVNGTTSLWPYFGVGMLAGSMSAIGSPATRALTPELVPGELLQGAIALRNVAGQIGVVVGPALGGIIFAIKPSAVYVLAGALLTVALAAYIGLPPTRTRNEEPVNFENLVAGIRFIGRTRVILGVILLDLFGVLLGDPIALAPVFASTILGVGPVGLGALRMAGSVGALLAAFLIARRSPRWPAGAAMLTVVAIFGLSTIVFGLSTSLPLSLAALFVSGFVDMISVNIRATMLAILTPLRLQGRVNSVEWVFISASNELGAFEAGGMAALLGPVRAVVLGGTLMIGIAASWRRLFPELARLGPLDELKSAGE